MPKLILYYFYLPTLSVPIGWGQTMLYHAYLPGMLAEVRVR